jgi:hypothetical protein
MASREETRTMPLGMPKVGQLDISTGHPRVPIRYGNGLVDYATDSAHARAMAAAWEAAAHLLEAEQDRRVLDGEHEPSHPERPADPAPTAVMPVVPGDGSHHVPPWMPRRPEHPVLTCRACGRAVRPATDEELHAAIYGSDLPQPVCDRCTPAPTTPMEVTP